MSLLNTNVKISFVTVVKNEEDFISLLIDSIINTTPSFIHWELLVIDDHSHDSTKEIVSNYSLKDKRIKYELNPYRGKVGGTKFGFEEALYEWVKFLDGDDYIDFKELQPNHFNSDSIIHNYWELDSKGLKRIKISDDIINNRDNWIGNLRSIPKAMFFFKKSLIRNSNIFDKCIFEDLVINISVLYNSKKIVKIDNCLYYYRQHSNNYYGNSFFGNPQKVKLLGHRLINTIEVCDIYYPEIKLNSHLNSYASILVKCNLKKLFSLLLADSKLCLKAIYYHLIKLYPFC